MKTILLIISILFAANCMAQQPKIDYKSLDQFSKIEFQHDYTRFCLKKYHDEKMKAYVLQLSGLAIAGAGMLIPVQDGEAIYNSGYPDEYTVYTEDNTIRNVGFIVGGAAFLGGIILQIDSEKWLKRAYFGPNGIGVRFEF